MKAFTHAKLVLADKIREDGFLLEEDGRILETGCMKNFPGGSMEIIPCKGMYLAPGFIELHSHGGGGHDFMDGTAEAIIGAARTHLAHGTTSIFPTTTTSSDEDIFCAIEKFHEARRVARDMPCMPGLHLEGPYFNAEQKGAQNPAYIRSPGPAHYNRILEAAQGCVRRWSVAPELDGALEMARKLSPQGILFSIGHSSATYDQVSAAVDAGFTHVTHLYSGMSTIVRKNGYRVLGVVESAYLLDALSVEIIADGIHLPPELLRLILKCKDNSKICLVTDSMRGAGQSDGPSVIGSLKDGLEVIIEDGIAKMPDRNSFAGSVATADRLIRVMTQKAGLSLHEAITMMTKTPARIAGLPAKGELEAGRDADLVLFDDGIAINRVFVAGNEVNIRGDFKIRKTQGCGSE
jgi:N-acetylglucosamine-6-phosphate deacetylase